MDVERDVNALDPMPDRTPPSREDGARLLGLALKAAREKRGKSRHDVAALVGATYQAVANWEKGSNGPSRDRLVQICEYLGIDINAALKGDVIYVTDYVTTPSEKPDNKLVSGATLEDNVKIVSGPTMPPPPNRANAPLDVPVYGIAVGGVDADFQFNGTVAEHVRRPPAISGLRDVYAVHVVNESMYPAYREGDLLYVNPNRQPVIGDDVIVELHPTDEAQGAGKAFIKRLKRRTPTKIVCEQFNPPCDLEFDREAIKALHRVIPMRELLGT